MTEDTLNRIGILLNFTAGFLLSPSLLGLERLRRLEMFFERALGKVHALLTPRPDRNGSSRDELHNQELEINRRSWVVLIVLWLVAFRFLKSGSMFGFGTVIGFIVAGLLIVYHLLGIFEFVLRHAVRSLEGEDRLISGMTITGIVTFSIGNALQFWATFHPGRQP